MKAIHLTLFTSLFAVFSACKMSESLKFPKNTLEEKIIVKRDIAGNYTFELYPAGEWEIYKGTSPENINWVEPLASVDGKYLFSPLHRKNTRMFFGLISPDGDTTIATERRIPMQGQSNFRDLGGFPVADGRQVKWGMLYRSGRLSDLSDLDKGYFETLDIRTVIDLRNDVEVAKHPDDLPDGVQYHQYSISDKEGKAYKKLKRMVMREGYRREKAKELFTNVMRTFADSFAVDAKPIFDILTQQGSPAPLVYHCTGGKDRTGFVSAMILSALGVERDIIMNDYLMSNYYRKDENVRRVRKARLIGLDKETLEYALLVREDYMNAVFAVMDEYGGTDAYLEKKFGLGKRDLIDLRSKYTTHYVAAKDGTQ